MRSTGETDVSSMAATVQRLGVLLAAGITPMAAWGYLERRGPIAAIAREAATGVPVPRAILLATARSGPTALSLWRAIAAAWSVATDAGAPLAPTLIELAGCIRDLAESQRQIAVALASPTATARLVLALPAVGLVFGTLLGFNTVGTLFTTPIGWLCLGLGGGLVIVAARWNRRMVRAAQPRELTPGLPLDLMAIAVAGGGALDRAHASVSEALDLCGVVSEPGAPRDAEFTASMRVVDDVLDLSSRAGVPAAALLRAEATELRRAARARATHRAQQLSVRLMIPLGLCVLPSFMLLSVVPLLVTVLGTTHLG